MISITRVGRLRGRRAYLKPAGLAPSLLAAVRADYIAAGLLSTVGIYRAELVRRGEAPPHVVATFRVLGIDPNIEPTPDGQADAIQLAFTCRAATAYAARKMAEVVDAWMLADGGRQFRWEGGDSGPAFRDGTQRAMEPGRDRSGRRVFAETNAYRLTVWGKP